MPVGIRMESAEWIKLFRFIKARPRSASTESLHELCISREFLASARRVPLGHRDPDGMPTRFEISNKKNCSAASSDIRSLRILVEMALVIWHSPEEDRDGQPVNGPSFARLAAP